MPPLLVANCVLDARSAATRVSRCAGEAWARANGLLGDERNRRSLGTTSVRVSTCEFDVHLRLSAVVRCATKHRGYDAQSAEYGAWHAV